MSGGLELEAQPPGQGPNKKRHWDDVKSGEMGENQTYAQKVQNGHVTEAEKAFLLSTLSEDFTRLAGKVSEGKAVFQSKTSLSMGKALSGLHKAMACGLYLYFMGKPPSEEEFRRWFTELYGEKVSLQKFYFAGKGFYQALVETPMQRDYVLSTVAAFRGNLVFTVPWSPTLHPEDMLQHHCPVWVEFPNLPFYLWEQVKEVAGSLGKVLHVPYEGKQETKAVKKACILWDRRQQTPDLIKLDVEGYNLFVEVKFQSFPDACYKCKISGHFARDCPGLPTPSPNTTTEGEGLQESKDAQKGNSAESTPSTSKELVLKNKEKVSDPPAESKQSSKQAGDEGWKTLQGKKQNAKPGQTGPGKPLQDSTNKPKAKGNLKKMARTHPKPLATMLEDKENMYAVVNLSDE